MMQVSFFLYRFLEHVSSPLIQARCLIPPATFLRCRNRLPVSYRNRSCMSGVVKRTPGVRATENEVAVDFDAKPSAGDVKEGSKSQWQACVEPSTIASKSCKVQHDSASDERLGAELAPSKNQAKTRRSVRRNKASDPVLVQENVLRAYNVALVLHDHEDIPSLHPQVVTADWVYLRFHGRNYTERYSLDALQKQAVWIRAQMKGGRDVFAYFNNDASGHAVFNALELREFVLGSEESLKP